MAIKKWVAVNDGINTKILTDNDPSKVSVYEIDLIEPEDTAQVATLGAWLDLVDKVNNGNKNVLYKVEDMAGVAGFADNEAALVHIDGTGKAFIQKEMIYSKAANSLKMQLPTPRTYTSTTTAGATPSINFGDIETDTIRDEFFKGAVIDVQYGFHRGSIFHRGTVISKTGDGANPTDNMVVEGYKFENNKFESFTLTVNPAGITDENYIPFKGSGFEFDTVKLPAAYADAEALPNSVIGQKINNAIALLPKPLTGNYTSQVENLKIKESLSDLTSGLKKEYTFPNGLTTDTVGGCEIAMNYSNNGEVGTTTQGFDLRGWDTTKPLYLSMTYHSAATYIWVELKMEAVVGDNTKYSLTNFKSGAGSAEMNAFGVASIQFKGGQ